MNNYFEQLPEYFKKNKIPSVENINNVADIKAHYPPHLFSNDQLTHENGSKISIRRLAATLNGLANRRELAVVELGKILRHSHLPFTQETIADAISFLSKSYIAYANKNNDDAKPLAQHVLISLQLLVMRYPNTRGLILTQMAATPLNPRLLSKNSLIDDFFKARQKIDSQSLLTIIKEIINEQDTIKHYALLSNFFIELPFMKDIYLANKSGLDEVQEYLTAKQRDDNIAIERVHCIAFLLLTHQIQSWYEVNSNALKTLFTKKQYIPGLYHLQVEPISILAGPDSDANLSKDKQHQTDNDKRTKIAEISRISIEAENEYFAAQTALSRYRVQSGNSSPLRQKDQIKLQQLNKALNNKCYSAIGYLFHDLGAKILGKAYIEKAIKAGDIFCTFYLSTIFNGACPDHFFAKDFSSDIPVAGGDDVFMQCAFAHHALGHILLKYAVADTFSGRYAQNFKNDWLMKQPLFIGPVLDAVINANPRTQLGILAYLAQDFVMDEYLYDFGLNGNHDCDIFKSQIQLYNIDFSLSPSIYKIFKDASIKLIFLSEPIITEVLSLIINKIKSEKLVFMSTKEVEKLRVTFLHMFTLNNQIEFLRAKLFDGLIDSKGDFSFNKKMGAELFNFETDEDKRKEIQHYCLKKNASDFGKKKCENALEHLKKLDTADFGKIRQDLLCQLYESDLAKIQVENNPVKDYKPFLTAILSTFTQRKDLESLFDWLSDEKISSDKLTEVKNTIKNRFLDKEAIDFFPTDIWLKEFKFSKNNFFANTKYFDVTLDIDLLNELKKSLTNCIKLASLREDKGSDISFRREQEKLLMRFFLLNSMQAKRFGLCKPESTVFTLNPLTPVSTSTPQDSKKEIRKASGSTVKKFNVVMPKIYDHLEGWDLEYEAPDEHHNNNNQINVNHTEKNTNRVDDELSASSLGSRKLQLIYFPIHSATPVYNIKKMTIGSHISALHKQIIDALPISANTYLHKEDPCEEQRDYLRITDHLIDWIEACENNNDILDIKPSNFERIKDLLEIILLNVTQGMFLNRADLNTLRTLLKDEGPSFMPTRKPHLTFNNPHFIKNMKEHWIAQNSIVKDKPNGPSAFILNNELKKLERVYHRALMVWLHHIKNNSQQIVRHESLDHKTIQAAACEMIAKIEEPLDKLLNQAELILKAFNVTQDKQIKSVTRA